MAVMKKSDKKTETKEETSEEILARLQEMSNKLSVVSEGAYADPSPEIEVVQTRDDITSVLHINGEAYPGLWFPAMHGLLVAYGVEVDQDKLCKQTDPATGCVCTKVNKRRCEGGWAHVGETIWPENFTQAMVGDPLYDVTQAIWASAENSNQLWLRDGKGADQILLALYDNTAVYRKNLGEGEYCREQASTGFTCSLHPGHRYSHIAGNGDFILQIW